MVPDDAKCAPAACQNNCLWHGHIRQLFHWQRLAKHGALRDPILESDLGHFDPLSTGVNMSRPCKTTTSWSTNCGTGASGIGTGTKDSIICSTVCRCTRSCGRGSQSGASRIPLAKLYQKYDILTVFFIGIKELCAALADSA